MNNKNIGNKMPNQLLRIIKLKTLLMVSLIFLLEYIYSVKKINEQMKKSKMKSKHDF
jgi:uncharacterized ion transporter superfamily protein YfcC